MSAPFGMHIRANCRTTARIRSGVVRGIADLSQAQQNAIDNCKVHCAARKLWVRYNNNCGALEADGEIVTFGTAQVRANSDQESASLKSRSARGRAVRQRARGLFVRNVHLGIAAGCCRVYYCDNSINVAMHRGTLGIAKYHDGNRRPLRFCWYWMFLSVDSRRSNLASSAAFSNAPLANLSHPRAIASTTV